MASRARQFIVLEGIDGSGKTTVGRAVAAAMTDVPVRYTSHKEIATISPEVERTMRDLAGILWPRDQSAIKLVPSEARVLMHAAWFSLFSALVVEPAQTSSTVLLDGWYHKLKARLLVDGYQRPFLDAIFSAAREPDHLIMLDPDVEAIWERGQGAGRSFGPVEMGLYAGYPELGRASFVDYQSRVRAALVELARERGTDVILVRAADSVDETCAAVEAHLRDLLGGQTGGGRRP